MFSFLRYYGPKRLRGACRVLLDEGIFQITQGHSQSYRVFGIGLLAKYES